VGIPESQLETWSHQGSITNSSNTYQAIRNVLEADGTPYAERSYEIFLQGSYGNDTNVYAESDVDVVIEIDSIYYSDLSQLSEEEKKAYAAARSPAEYTLKDFKRDVASVLRKQYGNSVTEGDKAIAIAASGNRRKADVIVAAEFRRYWKFDGNFDHNFTKGICFFNSAGDRIANYPKRHSENLTTKHKSSGTWLKPMIRILKNLRTRIVEDGGLKGGVAPSYYIEGLLYNVPAEKYGKSYSDTFVNAINWIQKEADKSKFTCANEQYYLLRDAPNVCWKPTDAETFLSAIVKRWNEW
jgi:hypothetical protein